MRESKQNNRLTGTPNWMVLVCLGGAFALGWKALDHGVTGASIAGLFYALIAVLCSQMSPQDLVKFAKHISSRGKKQQIVDPNPALLSMPSETSTPEKEMH